MSTITNNVSVKIMRSYDYNHFEVSLSANNDEGISLGEVDNLRKEAQRLADKAVKQYKIAKEMADKQSHLDWERKELENEVDRIKEHIPAKEWTPEQMAKIKVLKYRDWREYAYDYEDDNLF